MVLPIPCKNVNRQKPLAAQRIRPVYIRQDKEVRAIPKIIYIDPVGPEIACPGIIDNLGDIKNSETNLDFTHLDSGPSNLEYRYSEALVVPGLLNKIKKLEKEGYDGAIIGCFYDPGLYEAREILNQMVVTAPAEASMHIGAVLGHRFSVLVGRRKWIPRITENISKYGITGKFASFKSLEMGVDDFQGNKEITLAQMEKLAREAVEEDGAEVIILGCTMQFGYYQKLQEAVGVPVIDPVIAALKHAEMLISLREKVGLYVSKKYAFESPPDLNI